MTSTIKVNKIEKVDGSTIEIGGACTAVNLASGATQSGFGRTGTVDWCTTAKTSPFTATSGDGFFVNTTGGAITVTLPSSPSAGDIVSLADYANTWGTACKGVTVCRNGSKINGVCQNANLNTVCQSITLVYVDGTRGWKNVQILPLMFQVQLLYLLQVEQKQLQEILKYIRLIQIKFCSFFCSNTASFNDVSFVVVAGGGGGAGDNGAGGGAGGFRK